MNRDSWFTRGWTLQELLAPQDIRFYNMDWDDLLLETENPLDLPFFPDSLTVADIYEKIRQITSITEDELMLCRCGETEKIPISQRLELAADQQVTREEDLAYSLMGLLGVDISVAYGEGSERASFRLLRELLTVKKHVLDIFNHGYWEMTTNTLIPKTLAQYKMRSSTRMPIMSDNEICMLLNNWEPIEPIIPTHLGVRIPLLLVPAFKSMSTWEVYPDPALLEEKYVSRGSFSGNIALHIWEETDEAVSSMVYYNLLDERIYTYDSPFAAYTVGQGEQKPPSISAFGVMNFSIDNNDILVLPQWCFSILLNCGSTTSGEVQQSGSVKILPTRTAPIFQLKSARNKDRIPKDKLGDHGI